MQPIIDSFLDTDLYKLTMMQCVYHFFDQAQAFYRFQCRNDVPIGYLKARVTEQAQALKDLRFKDDEIEYLRSLPYMKDDFLNYLKNYQFNLDYLKITDQEDSLSITIDGPWLETILYEVPMLAIVSECYSEAIETNDTLQTAQDHLQQKIDYLKSLNDTGFGFTDFGTRRRFKKHWHDTLIAQLTDNVPDYLMGTSNIWLARKYELPPIGTMAHEFLQAAQALAPSLAQSQQYALKTWLQEYPNHLGVALTDCITMDAFLEAFDKPLAEKYTGLRQDSGDPYEWTHKALKHYKKLGIDPKDKTFIYSDSLTLPKAYKIYDTFKDVVNPAFGIGTNLTNDAGFETLDIVIKLNHLNDQPVIKVSDSPGKIICDDPQFLKYFKKQFGLGND